MSIEEALHGSGHLLSDGPRLFRHVLGDFISLDLLASELELDRMPRGVIQSLEHIEYSRQLRRAHAVDRSISDQLDHSVKILGNLRIIYSSASEVTVVFQRRIPGTQLIELVTQLLAVLAAFTRGIHVDRFKHVNGLLHKLNRNPLLLRRIRDPLVQVLP